MGEFKAANKQEGQSTCSFAVCAKYVGEWKAGKKEGQGTFSFASGDKYVGEWKADQKEGKNTYCFARSSRRRVLLGRQLCGRGGAMERGPSDGVARAGREACV